MPTPSVSVAGRCTHCLAPVDSSAGCQPCWARYHSEAATKVMNMTEVVTIPNLITAFVAEDALPIFQRSPYPDY